MTSIFVAKLDFNTTDEQLKSLFERYGKVNRVTIAKDRETGKPRGFAFVEMLNEQEAEAAISALDNSTVNGRTIAVKKADDRGSKPQEGNQSSFNRNDRPPRQDFKSSTTEKPPFRKQEDFAPTPSTDHGDLTQNPVKTERKKEKPKDNFDSKDRPKQQKMAAYKKSGKSNRFFDDEEDDLDDWMNSRQRSSGWDDEEE